MQLNGNIIKFKGICSYVTASSTASSLVDFLGSYSKILIKFFIIRSLELVFVVEVNVSWPESSWPIFKGSEIKRTVPIRGANLLSRLLKILIFLTIHVYVIYNMNALQLLFWIYNITNLFGYFIIIQSESKKLFLWPNS